MAEVEYPTNINIILKLSGEQHTYSPLMRMLQLVYIDYKSSFVPIILFPIHWEQFPKFLENQMLSCRGVPSSKVYQKYYK